ncbi:MAG: ABC transporter permease [Bdellovibrionales bacterium]
MKKLPVTLGVFLVYLFLFSPMIVLVILSFNSAERGAAWLSFTTHWYEKLFSNEDILMAFATSVRVAFSAGALSLIFGTSVAISWARGPKFFRQALGFFVYLPIMLPDVVIGLSLLSFFVLLSLPLGELTVVLAHTAFGTAYVSTLVRTRLLAMDPLVEDAARDLGASQSKVFFRILVPQMWTTLISGFLMVFTLSFDDFIISFFTAGVGVTTLPLKVYSMLKFGVTPEINALCAFILCLSIVLVFSSFLFQNRRLQKHEQISEGAHVPTS